MNRIKTLIIVFLLISTNSFAQTYLWRYRNHATDCTSLTDGKLRDLCYEEDSERLFKCEPTAGDCDTVGEWKEIGVESYLKLDASNGPITGALTTSNGSILSSASGVLTLGGTGGTNNENLTLDFETNAGQITMSGGYHRINQSADDQGLIIYGFDDQSDEFLRMYVDNNDRSRIDGKTLIDLMIDSSGVLVIESTGVRVEDDTAYKWGGGAGNVWATWETTGNDNFQLGTTVGSATDSGYISIMEKADMGDADRSPLATSANPVLRVYSSDATQALDYIEMYHDQTDGNIAVGSGDLKITPAGGDFIVDSPGTGTIKVDGASGTAEFDFLEAGAEQWRFGYDIANNKFFIRNTPGAHTIISVTDNSVQDALYISSTGVAIGDTSAAAELDVGGGTATSIDGTDDLLVKDDAEIDGDLYVEGTTTLGLASTYTGGSAYVCVYDSGVIYASETACP